MAYPSSNLPRVTFRLAEELLDKLKEAADEKGHGLNTEIVNRLRESFGEIERPFTPAQEEALNRMVEAATANVTAKTEWLLKEMEDRYRDWGPPAGTRLWPEEERQAKEAEE